MSDLVSVCISTYSRFEVLSQAHFNVSKIFWIHGYLDTSFFSPGPSMRLVSIAALAQALVGLGTGRSPFSSGCSPSAQSRSITFFHSFLCANHALPDPAVLAWPSRQV